MPSKRQLQKEITRKRIIETAYHVYSEQGFNATTATIAREAGLSHGAIFVHFPSLEDLMTCLIEEFGLLLASELHRLVEANKSMEELLNIYLDVLSKHEQFYSRLITERSRLPKEVRLTLANMQSVIAHHFNHALEHEMDKNTIKKLPVHMIFNTWMGLTHYYLLNKELFSPEDPVLERYRDDIIATFLELIKK